LRPGSLDDDKEITSHLTGDDIMTRTETPRRRHDVTAVTTTIRARIREARESRTRHRALWHELAQYTSADDLNDLEAAVARYDDAETHDIRRILAAQRALAA
jgi:siroheme synthase (precorrin-2 oxidase/ferrochelatase)